MLLDGLDDDSKYKTASDRDGDWSEAEYRAAEIHNEIARLRASFHAAHGGQAAAYEPVLQLSPVQQRLRREKEQREAEEQRVAEEQFEADLGWT